MPKIGEAPKIKVRELLKEIHMVQATERMVLFYMTMGTPQPHNSSITLFTFAFFHARVSGC